MSSIGEQLSSRKHLFTPSTPYVHKFRTEMCKNYELYKKCKYGDEVSINRVSKYLFYLCVFEINFNFIVFLCSWQTIDYDQE